MSGAAPSAPGLPVVGPQSAPVTVEADLPRIRLVRPLPGFPDVTAFVLVRLGGPADGADAGSSGSSGSSGSDGSDGSDDESTGTMFELRGADRPEVRFLVAAPTVFFPDYAFDLDESHCAELGLHDASEALVLVVLTIGDDSASTTANLLAPVVINARTRAAAQVILSGTNWPVRAAVV